ncbi:MAG TPA: trigger factor [bacterium]|nr:trigger factor [bacterium]
MKVQIEDISPIKKKIAFEVEPEAYQKALDKAYDKLKKKVSIKGFRKGKVPRSILEKYYRSQTEMETVSELIDKSYKEAITEHHIHAVDMPKISDLKVEGDKPITFTAEVEIQPKVETKDYLKIKLKRPKLEVTDEELDKELKALQKAHAQRVPAAEGTAVADGHQVTINYAGTVDGVPFEGGSAKDQVVDVGAGRYLVDFEKGLIGMKRGEAKEVPVQFPADYGHEPLQGKLASFRLEVQEIKEESLPPLDDEFAKDLGQFQTFEEVKNSLKDHMLKAKEQQSRGELFTQVLEHLIAKNPFDIPEGMISRELDYMQSALDQQLKQQGLTMDKLGVTPQDYREKNREEAIRRIKGFLLFDSIALQNQLEVTEEELQAKLAEVAQRYKQPVEAIHRYYQEHNLIRPLFNQILEEKTLSFLLDKAEIKEIKDTKEGKKDAK